MTIHFVLRWTAASPGRTADLAAPAEEAGRSRVAQLQRQRTPSTADRGVADPIIPQVHINKPNSEKGVTSVCSWEALLTESSRCKVFSGGASKKAGFGTRVTPGLSSGLDNARKAAGVLRGTSCWRRGTSRGTVSILSPATTIPIAPGDGDLDTSPAYRFLPLTARRSCSDHHLLLFLPLLPLHQGCKLLGHSPLAQLQVFLSQRLLLVHLARSPAKKKRGQLSSPSFRSVFVPKVISFHIGKPKSCARGLALPGDMEVAQWNVARMKVRHKHPQYSQNSFLGEWSIQRRKRQKDPLASTR